MRSMKVANACVPSFSPRSFVCCYESMPAARCYSGSRDEVQIDQKREYTLASMERRPFPVYRQCGDDGG